jgi:hypothetical protein
MRGGETTCRQAALCSRPYPVPTLYSLRLTDLYLTLFLLPPFLCDIWCSTGAKFADICKLTDTMEGSIIRVLRRLEELLRQLASASLAIGNSELKNMFEEGSARIRRGVVFAASLYL